MNFESELDGVVTKFKSFFDVKTLAWKQNYLIYYSIATYIVTSTTMYFYYCQAQVQFHIQIPNPGPKSRSQIQVSNPSPKSKIQTPEERDCDHNPTGHPPPHITFLTWNVNPVMRS